MESDLDPVSGVVSKIDNNNSNTSNTTRYQPKDVTELISTGIRKYI